MMYQTARDLVRQHRDFAQRLVAELGTETAADRLYRVAFRPTYLFPWFQPSDVAAELATL